MSKIRDSKGRTDGHSGYTRVVGNAALGQLLSRVQATVIANGNELERLIAERCCLIDNFDDFVEKNRLSRISSDVYLCRHSTFKKSEISAKVIKGIEPDMLIFTVKNPPLCCSRRQCKVIELKDGDTFDTKKSQAEQERLKKFAISLGTQIPFTTDYYICCFNQDDKKIIMSGFKGVFALKHILTGQELCELLGIDYSEILAIRKQDSDDNSSYLIEQMLKIPEVRAEIRKQLSDKGETP